MKYFIGWDVGGWNCDSNPKSRDAIVILDENLKILGLPWRGNLRNTINVASTSEEFTSALFELCGLKYVSLEVEKVVFAIDIPLGFSRPFIDLIVNKKFIGTVGDSSSNEYLYRYTERFLFQNGLKPLSSIKDMIGSQTTKGMHVLAKFTSESVSCGVWNDRDKFFVIEAYPSACKQSETVQVLVESIFEGSQKESKQSSGFDKKKLNNPDKYDALICALIGWLNFTKPSLIAQPDSCVDHHEGWIYVPLDGMNQGT